MDSTEAVSYIELFVNNLIEYVEEVAGNDYRSVEEAVYTIAGSEFEFWAALDILKERA